MPTAASLKNLRPWRPRQSGNPKGRPRAPRLTERDQHVIVAALAMVFDEATQQAAVNGLRAALSNRSTALRAVEFVARLNGELGQRRRNR